MLEFLLSVLETDEDRERFRLLYKKYQNTMLKTANSILTSPSLAEDAVQQAWLKVIENFDKIFSLPGDKLGGYIVVIVKNVSLTMLHKEKRLITLPEWLQDEKSPAHDDYSRLIEIIRSLPGQYRQILELKFVLEWSNKEIAAFLKMNESTVASRIARGREELKHRLEKEGIYE